VGGGGHGGIMPRVHTSLCKPINHNKNGVVGLGTHEICDEIHKKTTMDFQ